MYQQIVVTLLTSENPELREVDLELLTNWKRRHYIKLS